MPFRPRAKLPGFADLITSLNTSRNQITDNPLYQTVFLLLQRITTNSDIVEKQIKDVEEKVDTLLSFSYLTVDDESAVLVNARQELAGPGITFDDSIPHKRTVSASGGGVTIGGNTSPSFITREYEEDNMTIPISL